MKTELHTLSSCITLLVAVRPVYGGTDMLLQVKEEIKQLKVLFNASFNHFKNAFLLTEAMNTRYTVLVNLANSLWASAAQHNLIRRAAMMELIALIAYMEAHYSGFLNIEQALADFDRFKLHNDISAKLITISSLLVAKGVPKDLVYQITKAVDDLFNTDKHPVFTRADRQYLQAFMISLFVLAADQRAKDWNSRLRRLLIQWNFNHMGIYKVLEAEQLRDASANRGYEKQHQYLFEQGFQLEQIQPMTTSEVDCSYIFDTPPTGTTLPSEGTPSGKTGEYNVVILP